MFHVVKVSMVFDLQVFSAVMTTLLAVSELLPIITKGRVKGICNGLYTLKYDWACIRGELTTETSTALDGDVEAQKRTDESVVKA
jgi:hypothetical protein